MCILKWLDPPIIYHKFQLLDSFSTFNDGAVLGKGIVHDGDQNVQQENTFAEDHGYEQRVDKDSHGVVVVFVRIEFTEYGSDDVVYSA